MFVALSVVDFFWKMIWNSYVIALFISLLVEPEQRYHLELAMHPCFYMIIVQSY